MVDWEPVSYINKTPVEQIQSAPVKSNQPVNTGHALDGADYHFTDISSSEVYSSTYPPGATYNIVFCAAPFQNVITYLWNLN